MKIHLSKSHNVYKNLALEESILKLEELKEDILYIYQNANSIIIGRNQNIYEEINQEYTDENKINLARRISGGGAVYQDMGNICFSFITKNKKGGGFIGFLQPIIDFLNENGLKAEFHGRNDLLVNGFKISGNAQYIYKDRIVHHGTILFDADLSILSKSLKPNLLKLKSKSIKSIRQRVSNIKPLLKEKCNVNEFIEKLILYFSDKASKLLISDDILNEAANIEKRNESWDWIYGKSPEFEHEVEYYFKGGLIKIYLDIKNGKIENINIYGDFLAKKPIDPIINKLKNIPYKKEAIFNILSQFNLEEYFGSINSDEIIETILKAKGNDDIRN